MRKKFDEIKLIFLTEYLVFFFTKNFFLLHLVFTKITRMRKKHIRIVCV